MNKNSNNYSFIKILISLHQFLLFIGKKSIILDDILKNK